MISNYNAVVDELARVSVSGDFDRTCLFAVARAPCSMLDFKAVADAREFAYKFANVVKTHAIDKCGKEHLKNALAPLLMQNIDILDNAANGICPTAPNEVSYDPEAFDNADYASMPIFTTTTSTVADTAPKTTPKPASDISGSELTKTIILNKNWHSMNSNLIMTIRVGHFRENSPDSAQTLSSGRFVLIHRKKINFQTKKNFLQNFR